MQLLLRLGIQPDAVDDSGATPLHVGEHIVPGICISLAVTDLVFASTHLMFNVAGVHWLDLAAAAYKGHQAVVAHLVAHLAGSLDALDRRGSTPLMLAAARGHEGALKLVPTYLMSTSQWFCGFN